MGKRVQVTFTDEQWGILQRFKGKMGESDADVIRNIVLSWLSEKSIMSTIVKREISEGEK
ncbi:CopG family transcriptional regulator [Thermococcus sp. JdF3]|nr:CopG family transcriptional regulator [Thermococcus sp. JdF3]